LGTAKIQSNAVRRRVLIVEDNRDAREMFRMMLELDGHEVVEADEGCAGLRLLQSEVLDVAFIDVGLPGMDGYEIARRFRRDQGARKSVLLVALTGYGTPDAVERSRHAGFDHHLIKPVNPEALHKLIANPGQGRLAARKAPPDLERATADAGGHRENYLGHQEERASIALAQASTPS
jgi:CheY-like chemotaxis protein